MQYEECVNLHNFILNASPNQRHIYYVGMHARDSHLSEQLQKLAWEYALKGKIYLVQERKQAFMFRYIAIKASSPPIGKLIPEKEREIKSNPNMRRYGPRKRVLATAEIYNG